MRLALSQRINCSRYCCHHEPVATCHGPKVSDLCQFVHRPFLGLQTRGSGEIYLRTWHGSAQKRSNKFPVLLTPRGVDAFDSPHDRHGRSSGRHREALRVAHLGICLSRVLRAITVVICSGTPRPSHPCRSHVDQPVAAALFLSSQWLTHSIRRVRRRDPETSCCACIRRRIVAPSVACSRKSASCLGRTATHSRKPLYSSLPHSDRNA